MPSSTSYSLQEAKQRIEAYCAYQERCTQEVHQKLVSWNLSPQQIDHLIADLEKHRFLDEFRFAEAFVSGKFRIKKWGKIKIRQHLKLKGVPAGLIEKALEQIGDKEYLETMQALVQAKDRLIRARDPWDRLIKLKRYLASKGFEPSFIHEVVT